MTASALFGFLTRPQTIALLASVVGGAFVTFIWSELWHAYLRRKMGGQPLNDRARPIGITLGILERLLLTAFVLWLPTAVGAFAGAWILVKSAGGWGDIAREKPHARMRFFVHLSGSIASVLWAVGCGMLARQNP